MPQHVEIKDIRDFSKREYIIPSYCYDIPLGEMLQTQLRKYEYTLSHDISLQEIKNDIYNLFKLYEVNVEFNINLDGDIVNVTFDDKSKKIFDINYRQILRRKKLKRILW